MAKPKVTDREDTCMADQKLIEGTLKLEEYKNRYVTEEIKRFRSMRSMTEAELARRSGYTHDDLKRFYKDQLEIDENGRKVATHMPSNVVFGIAISLELGRADFNRLLDSAGYAPLKSHRTWRGDHLILTSFEKIEKCFSNGDNESAEKLIEVLNKEFGELGLKQPFKRRYDA